jgi:hypothetical protein
MEDMMTAEGNNSPDLIPVDDCTPAFVESLVRQEKGVPEVLEGERLPVELITPELVRSLVDEDDKLQLRKIHAPLSPKDQEFNRHIQIRPVGCDPQGRFLGDPLLWRDIEALLTIEEDLLVDPLEIERQMMTFEMRLKECGGDISKLSPKEFSFFQLGGHISRRRKQLLHLMQQKGGYALILEYVLDRNAPFDPSTRVPLAYNDGFLSMPIRGDELPIDGKKLRNLDAAKINGRTGGFVDIRHLIWQIWRAGVMDKKNEPILQRYKALGIVVPGWMHGISAQKRGFNNAFKVVIGQAAKRLKKQWIVYNTATLTRPDEVMDGAFEMPNRALRGSNVGVFEQLTRYSRSEIDKIVVRQRSFPSRVVADAHWDQFVNKPDKVLEKERDPVGVLMTKGGLLYDELLESGEAFHSSIERRLALK